MTELIVPPNLINKLGHNILEIRERALLTLLSKIDNGFIFENDLAQSKEMLTKLFEWFLFDPCPHEEMVLALIKRILLTSSGATLINHYGPNTIKKELKQVQDCLEPEYHFAVKELCEIIDTFEEENKTVPPLISDVPLSYRSGEIYKSNRSNIDTTATSFGGYISKGPSVEPQLENPGHEDFTAKETFTVDRESISASKASQNVEDILPNYRFQWQPLIEADKHVLDSVENSLKNPLQPSELLNSCEFFTDVLLHDFPAEVFLQRPMIVLILRDLLHSSSSKRVRKSILICFFNLTRALLKRIDHCNDPCLHCLKEYIEEMSQSSSPNSMNASSSEVKEFQEDSKYLKQNEISTTKYCLTTLKCVLDYLMIKPESLRDTSRNKHSNLYNAVILIEQLLELFKRCFSNEIWNVQPYGVFYDTLKCLNDCLISFGELVENYRIEVNTDGSNAKFRALHLCILHHCIYFLENFIPLDRSVHVIPKCLKNSLAMSLLDIPVAKLYPKVHSKILDYVKTFNENNSESLHKFQAVREVCESMSAAVKFMRSYNSSGLSTLLKLANSGILSLQFHENLSFVNNVIETCATKFSIHTNEIDAFEMEDMLLSLFSHNIDEVAEYTYELCHKKVISAIGPTLNMSGAGVSSAQIVFLLRSKILIEIAEYGLCNKNPQVKKYAQDIVIHLLKCKILVSEEIWDKVREALIPSFPILLVYASKLTPIGRTLINIVDPDIAKDLRLPSLDVFKSNTLLLFSPEDLVRDEAFSRLCWLLAIQENSKNLLPRLNNMNDKTLPNVCQISPKGFDVNKSKSTERFYQPTSLHHVMELLNLPKVEPAIRRSALTQIGVMMEDHLLHDMFLDKGGVESILKIMNNALVEEDYLNYADSVIPAVAILKSICLYNSKVRYELSHNLNVYQCILRGLFLFCTEERMKIDSSILLFLLLYSSFVQGTPSRANVAVPKLVYDKLTTPLICNVYRETSEYTNHDKSQYILSDKSCLSSIQIHWNSEVYGGFERVTQLESIEQPSDIKITENMKIQMKDLNQIKVSSVHFSIEECLKAMQKGESFPNSEEILNALMIYMYLYSLWKEEDDNSILNFPWEETFGKYLRILPSSEDDASLLHGVIKFLKVLVPFYKSSGKQCWIISIIKDPTHYVTDLMSIENSSEEHLKVLSKELISLITECVCQEHHFMNFYIESDENSNPTTEWSSVIEIVTNNLKFKDPQQMYNLAYLDSLLSCLVHLSGMLGWSNARRRSNPKQTMKEIIAGLCDLVDAFHYGKGPTAAVSLMGLSITRNVLLILNHVLAEMFNSNIKNWDLLFVEDISEQNKIYNFVVLWNTRDVVLRAAVLQFFAGLVKSARLSRDIVSHLKKKYKCLWSMALNIFLDKEEASIVRENAALILANLCTHRTLTNNAQILHSELIPLGYEEKSSNTIHSILDLLEQKKSMKLLKILILCLYTNNISDSLKTRVMQELTPKSSGHLYTYRSGSELSERSWTSNSKSLDEPLNIATPSLIKATVIFLHNLIELADQAYVEYLNERGLIKLIFRSICFPSIALRNTKELALYVELLEMNSEICFFLNRAVRDSPGCLGTVLHTKDCMNVIISLLNPKMYHTYLPQLFCLRNKLWTEIFSLIAAFLECGCQVEDPKKAFEILAIILDAIYECGPKNLVATICEAIGSFGATELQSSVLLAITLMLQIECSYELSKNQEFKNLVVIKNSMRNIMDTVKAPTCSELEKNSDSQDSQKHSKSSENISKYKMNLLEKIYFGEAVADISKPKGQDEIKSPRKKKKLMYSGAEICKLLLHLYDIYDLKTAKESNQKQVILAATSSILCVSNEAKYYALDTGFLQKVIENFREISIKLSIESIDCFRRMGDKKRISPVLKDLDCITGLLTNFLLENVSVKCEASCLGLADLIHKLWNWFALHKPSSVHALKLLSTFTTNCPFACQSLPFTSPVAGTGPRKSASSVSLLHVIVSKISREMDMLSKTHDILSLRLCFNILQNCSPVLECRICITKSNLLQGMLKLHPAITKRQKPWETIELIWLEYLQVFTVYPEGQMYVGKLPEVLDLILTLTQSTKSQNKEAALRVIQNIAFYTPNRARLLTTPNFIHTLSSKLEYGSNKEKITIVNTMWALAANNMKAKSVFKSAKLDLRLREALKKIQLLNDNSLTEDEIERMQYVLNILTDGESCK